MLKKLLTICIVSLMTVSLCACKTTPIISNGTEYVDNSVNVFEKNIVGELVENYTSLYDVTSLYEREGYQIAAAQAYKEDSIVVVYVGLSDSKIVIYNIFSGKENGIVTLKDIVLSGNTSLKITSSQTVCLYDKDAGNFYFPNFDSSDYKMITVKDEPVSIIVDEGGNSIYYTLENDCKIYRYITDTKRNTVLYDCSDIAESVSLIHLLSNGDGLIVNVESQGEFRYMCLSIENQSMEAVDMLGKYVYCIGEVYVFVEEEGNSVKIFNGQKPRIVDTFYVDSEDELDNITLFSGNPYMLTQTDVDDGVELKFYSLSRGILNNDITIPARYDIISTTYLEIDQIMCIEYSDEAGEYGILLWDVEAVQGIKQ